MPVLKPVKGCLYIKWLHAGLYRDAAYLESHSSENFLKQEDISELMTKSHKMGGFVITEMSKPIGYTIYEESNSVLEIINLVVHQDYRRKGIATLLLDRLMSRTRWNKMTVRVRESNLSAHLFLKEKGFLATNIERRYFQDYFLSGLKYEDAYHFEYQKHD